MPKNDLICEAAIRIAAPVENPTRTVCEMKFTSVPSRAMPMINWNTPLRNMTVSISRM